MYLHMMQTTCFKQVGTQQQNKQETAPKTPVGNAPQVTGDNIMIGYKRDIIEKLSHSKARMGRGSPLNERLHGRIEKAGWC